MAKSIATFNQIFPQNAFVQASLDFLHAVGNHPGHEKIEEVASGRNEPNDAAPAEFYTADINGIVQSMYATPDLLEKFVTMGRDHFTDRLVYFPMRKYFVRYLCEVNLGTRK